MMKIRLILVAAIMVALSACSGGGDKPAPAQGNAPVPAQGTDNSAPQSDQQKDRADFLKQLASYTTLPDAIAGLKPMMTDTTDETSPGAVALAVWSSDRMTWSELQKTPKTKAALVMKDSDQERGKLICAHGVIVEIASQTAFGSKLFAGGLVDENDNIFRFMAVRSTGELVEKSEATLCGVVVGLQDYQNSAGGTAHAVQLVGMFKLPENLKS